MSSQLTSIGATQPGEVLPLAPAMAIRVPGLPPRPAPLALPLQASRHGVREDGFVQRALWPLFHDLLPLARFETADWQVFRAVNRRLARGIARAAAAEGGDRPWTRDPLLMGVAAELRRLGAPVAVTYFMRLPFPAPDLLLRLPWRERLLTGLLAFDRLGFQTRRDLGNFLDCAQQVFPEVVARRGEDGRFRLAGRAGLRTCAVTAGVHPEGIDADAVASAAMAPEVERRLAALRGGAAGGRQDGLDGAADPGRVFDATAAERAEQGVRGRRRLVLAIDSLTPEQGTAEKLHAFAAAIELRPALRERVSLLLVLEPGPFGGTPAAAGQRREIARLVGEINGRLGRAGWVPIQYRFQQLTAAERLALYRFADVALVAPLRAGMGLWAKEYCAADVDERGALVLSEFAGAASQLAAGALLVNPHDAGAAARTLIAALRAGREERRRRMRLLRAEVRRHDLRWWMRELLPATRPAPPGPRTISRMAAGRETIGNGARRGGRPVGQAH
jgi:trehalose 6-phosphate synthase/phosphatase